MKALEIGKEVKGVQNRCKTNSFPTSSSPTIYNCEAMKCLVFFSLCFARLWHQDSRLLAFIERLIGEEKTSKIARVGSEPSYGAAIVKTGKLCLLIRGDGVLHSVL